MSRDGRTEALVRASRVVTRVFGEGDLSPLLTASIREAKLARARADLARIEPLKRRAHDEYCETLRVKGIGKPRENLYAVLKVTEIYAGFLEAENAALRAISELQ